VLIVDDEISVRKVMAAVLAQLGLPCETAASGEEALRILETRRIDAVISDLQMPGMSGMELLVKVRQSYPQMVFLVVTGVDDIRVGVEAMRQGADDYLVKPLQVDANIVSASLTRAWHVKRAGTGSRKLPPSSRGNCRGTNTATSRSFAPDRAQL